jgi:hypothetical protein
MQEYEIYLPMTYNDGSQVDPEIIQRIKDTLAAQFGGYTYLRQRNEGVWKIGGVTFRDEITLLRVLDNGGTAFDMADFKRQIERLLRQNTVLIVARPISIV